MSGGVVFHGAREYGTVRDVSYTVYFRDSEGCLRCLSRRAGSESEARDWFTRVGIAVVAIVATRLDPRPRARLSI
jgi:hypothetical protein